ncbi:hypothetical protein [Helicobacter suis]|uniref:hypothetical protein n=1 Tax=Helicobacter suis TaxID=104628 RepID=UPI0013D3EC2E|nr:hypothetical protein [Helicobacter suis]
MMLQTTCELVKCVLPQAIFIHGLPKESGLYFSIESIKPSNLSTCEVLINLYLCALEPPADNLLAKQDFLLEQCLNAPAFLEGRFYFLGANELPNIGFFSCFRAQLILKLFIKATNET